VIENKTNGYNTATPFHVTTLKNSRT